MKKIEIDAQVLIDGKMSMDNLMLSIKTPPPDEISKPFLAFHAEIGVALISAGLAHHSEDGFVVLNDKKSE